MLMGGHKKGYCKAKRIIQHHNTATWLTLEPGALELESSRLASRPKRLPPFLKTQCYFVLSDEVNHLLWLR